MKYKSYGILRLILGDQLNSHHSWFKSVTDDVLYVMMEVKTETNYVIHHVQKVVGIFSAMRAFCTKLELDGHHVCYIKINDEDNHQSFEANLNALIQRHQINVFQYQLPDEYRVDQMLNAFASNLKITHDIFDSEHFYTTRNELSLFFQGKRSFQMESFYRRMRKKHQVFMQGEQPFLNRWNFDEENRKKLPKKHVLPDPLLFFNNTSEVYRDLLAASVQTIGTIDCEHFIWPITREQAVQLLTYFIEFKLPYFGTFQDAMTTESWSVYHSHLSFALNLKMLSPREVIQRAIQAFNQQQDHSIPYNQVEGFVRQILGWREYMRGMYWMLMPDFASMNFFQHKKPLPQWFWTGETKMNCLKYAIKQSLQYAYAHHIQRLMLTGNFALLAGVDPNEVDAWYLGIYMDAFEWVEITNTRGMSQYADGGLIATKPYISSGAYIHKMSSYCTSCFYDQKEKVGDHACPFNSLYWLFFHQHEQRLKLNPRLQTMFQLWNKMQPELRSSLIEQARTYLNTIDDL